MGITYTSLGRDRRHSRKRVRISNTNQAYYIPRAPNNEDSSDSDENRNQGGRFIQQQRQEESSTQDAPPGVNSSTNSNNNPIDIEIGTRNSGEQLLIHPDAENIRRGDSSQRSGSDRVRLGSVTFVNDSGNDTADSGTEALVAETLDDMNSTLPIVTETEADDIINSNESSSLLRRNTIRRNYGLLEYRDRLNETERNLQNSITQSGTVLRRRESARISRTSEVPRPSEELSGEALRNNIQFNSNNFDRFTSRSSNGPSRSRSSSIHGILRSSRSSSFTVASNTDPADIPNQTSINTYNNALPNVNFTTSYERGRTGAIVDENAIDDSNDDEASDPSNEQGSNNEHTVGDVGNESTYQTTLQNTLRNSTIDPDSNTNQILRSRSNSRSTSRAQSRIYSPPPMPTVTPPSPPISRNRSPTRENDANSSHAEPSGALARNYLERQIRVLERMAASGAFTPLNIHDGNTENNGSTGQPLEADIIDTLPTYNTNDAATRGQESNGILSLSASNGVNSREASNNNRNLLRQHIHFDDHDHWIPSSGDGEEAEQNLLIIIRRVQDSLSSGRLLDVSTVNGLITAIDEFRNIFSSGTSNESYYCEELLETMERFLSHYRAEHGRSSAFSGLDPGRPRLRRQETFSDLSIFGDRNSLFAGTDSNRTNDTSDSDELYGLDSEMQTDSENESVNENEIENESGSERESGSEIESDIESDISNGNQPEIYNRNSNVTTAEYGRSRYGRNRPWFSTHSLLPSFARLSTGEALESGAGSTHSRSFYDVPLYARLNRISEQLLQQDLVRDHLSTNSNSLQSVPKPGTEFVIKAAEEQSLEQNGGRSVSAGISNTYETDKLRSFVRRAIQKHGYPNDLKPDKLKNTGGGNEKCSNNTTFETSETQNTKIQPIIHPATYSKKRHVDDNDSKGKALKKRKFESPI